MLCVKAIDFTIEMQDIYELKENRMARFRELRNRDDVADLLIELIDIEFKIAPYYLTPDHTLAALLFYLGRFDESAASRLADALLTCLMFDTSFRELHQVVINSVIAARIPVNYAQHIYYARCVGRPGILVSMMLRDLCDKSIMLFNEWTKPPVDIELYDMRYRICAGLNPEDGSEWPKYLIDHQNYSRQVCPIDLIMEALGIGPINLGIEGSRFSKPEYRTEPERPVSVLYPPDDKVGRIAWRIKNYIFRFSIRPGPRQQNPTSLSDFINLVTGGAGLADYTHALIKHIRTWIAAGFITPDCCSFPSDTDNSASSNDKTAPVKQPETRYYIKIGENRYDIYDSDMISIIEQDVLPDVPVFGQIPILMTNGAFFIDVNREVRAPEPRLVMNRILQTSS